MTSKASTCSIRRNGIDRACDGTQRRAAPYDEEPGFYAAAGLWLYGNVRLLGGKLCHVEAACGPPTHRAADLGHVEAEAERMVLDSRVLVCGIHNPAHQRAAVVPLRWGSPRVVVLSGGFRHHLGPDLSDEPFRVARLWRYQWDPKTDLAVSRRSPEKLPTYALHNPTVDRLIRHLAAGHVPERCTAADPFGLRVVRAG